MIKIGDFGLVVSAEQQIYSLTNSTEKKVPKSNDGTYLYMSPEQVYLHLSLYSCIIIKSSC